MAKIEPIREGFENMKAMLAHMAEDEEAVGFIGCVLRKDGTMVPVHFCATREHMSFAAALWLRAAVETE